MVPILNPRAPLFCVCLRVLGRGYLSVYERKSHWIKSNISNSNLNNSILLKCVSCCYCYCSATNEIFRSESRALLLGRREVLKPTDAVNVVSEVDNAWCRPRNATGITSYSKSIKSATIYFRKPNQTTKYLV